MVQGCWSQHWEREVLGEPPIDRFLHLLLQGLCVAVPGPCLLDLQNIVNTDTKNIAFIYTARSVGYLFGSVVGGVILDMVKSKQAVMTICNFFITGTMLAIPWSRNLGTLTGFMIVNGLSLGAVDIGGNVVCLTLWGSDSGPFYQALHFTFGLGGLVAPLIAAPFLGDYSSETSFSMDEGNLTYSGNFSNFTTDLLGVSSNVAQQNVPNIIYPFTIIGAFAMIVTVLFLSICIISPTEDNSTRAESKDNAKRNFGFLFSVVILNFFLLFVETGTEIGYAQMLTTYAVKGRLQLSSSVGSYMTSAFWAAFTVSRLASIFLAIKVSNLTLITYDLIITLVGAAVLLFLASYEWALWLASVLLGAGIASFFPAAVGWLDTYINVTNKIASIFTVGAAFGEMVVPFTISYFIDTIPEILIYIVPASCILSTLIVFILYMILRKKEKKIVNQEPTCPSVSGSISKS